MTTVAEPVKAKRGVPGFAQLQRIGRSLMLPIASLPAAALLLRLGQPDMLGADGLAGLRYLGWMEPVANVMAAAGDAIFANLALLFAVGVAIGFAKKADGSTALSAVVGYLVFKGVTTALSPSVLGTPAVPTPEGYLASDAAQEILSASGSPDYNALVTGAMKAALGASTQTLINYGVLGGIVIGVTAALLFQKFARVKLPAYLAFFGGRRFVPIVTAGVSLVIGVVLSLIYPVFDKVFNDWLGGFVTGSPILGGFVFGTLNRLLLPFGLHHLLNSMPWFQFGDYTTGGETYHGDIARFLHGDPTAGTFMTGFFPIMMFAIPAICLAFVHTAKTRNRKVIAGVMGSAALVSFVTGITEPVEFAFAYVAYPLYAIHAVLTGTSLALVNALGIRDGFGFSAGFIDYALNFRIANMPLLLLLIGLGYGVLYYVIFRWAITRWNLRTPGREDDPETEAEAATPVAGGSVAGAAVGTGSGAGRRPAATDGAMDGRAGTGPE